MKIEIERIKERYAKGEYGTRHNGKFFCQCSSCCNKCKGTTFLRLTRVHENGMLFTPLKIHVIKCPYCGGTGKSGAAATVVP
jgi:hypothetical protein